MRVKTLLVAIFAVLSVGFIYQTTAQALDNSRDCDQYAVIKCGTMNIQEARDKYSEGSRIFQSFGINKADLNSGTFKEGVVHRNGNVTVDGKIVATGAITAIRNMTGGTPIQDTNAARYPTSRMGDDQTALVKLDQNGKFLFAIMKPCGNPVTATPTPPPTPEPSAICKILKAGSVNNSRSRFQLDARAVARDGAKIQGYTFKVKNASGALVDSKKVTSSQESASYTTDITTSGSYTASVTVDTSVGKKESDQCTAAFTVAPEPSQPSYVCDQLHVTSLSPTSFSFTTNYTLKDASLQYITYVIRDGNGKEISRSRDTTYTQSNPATYSVEALVTVSVNGQDKTITAPSCKQPFTVYPPNTPHCPVPGKEHLPPNSPECVYCPISGKQHLPKDSTECIETPPVTPPQTPSTPELPKTGPLDSFASIVGLGSIIGTGSTYLISRRHLLAAWMSR
jgi:hypothetical protein